MEAESWVEVLQAEAALVAFQGVDEMDPLVVACPRVEHQQTVDEVYQTA